MARRFSIRAPLIAQAAVGRGVAVLRMGLQSRLCSITMSRRDCATCLTALDGTPRPGDVERRGVAAPRKGRRGRLDTPAGRLT